MTIIILLGRRGNTKDLIGECITACLQQFFDVNGWLKSGNTTIANLPGHTKGRILLPQLLTIKSQLMQHSQRVIFICACACGWAWYEDICSHNPCVIALTVSMCLSAFYFEFFLLLTA